MPNGQSSNKQYRKTRNQYEECARCGCLVGLGNLPRDYNGTTVCDDCFTILVQQDGINIRLQRYLGAWRERLTRLFRH